MTNDSNNAEEFSRPTQPSFFSIDYKRILFAALQYWYLVLASLLVGIVTAYIINRYTTRIFPVTASIIIREPQENSELKFLYNNPLINNYRNHFNEPYIIQSYPLIQSVIDSLNFNVIIQKEGNFLTTEQYQNLPITIKTVGEIATSLVTIKIIDSNHFNCNDDLGKSPVYKFGDLVNCNGVSFKVNNVKDISGMIGQLYQVRFADPKQITSSYVNRLKVSWAEQGSSVVNLDIKGPIVKKEIDFLNKLIELYQLYDLEKKNQSASRSLNFIEDQLSRVGDSLKTFERQLKEFKRQNFITDLTGEASTLYEALKELGEQQSFLKYNENLYKYLQDYIKTRGDHTQIILPSSVGVDDPVLNGLVAELVKLQSELNLLPSKSTNPLIVSKIKLIYQNIEENQRQLYELVNTLRTTDKIKISRLDQQMIKLEKELKVLPIAQQRYVSIQRNYTLQENLFLFLQQKEAEAGISRASNTSDIILINPPRLAGGATTPKEEQNYLLFGGLGLLIPFLLFILIELLNDKVQSKEDIDKLSSIPFIGVIGHNPINSSTVVHEKPKSSIAESFRSLRSNLNYFTQGKDKRIFLITSSISGEGKTFTTINLGTVLAMSGRKTIILGADMRRPKIYQDFNLNNDKGLSTYLSSISTLTEVIHPTGIENLFVISGGPVPPNPSELILTEKMTGLITYLKSQYDFILIDTPPIALITDALELAVFADHCIYVVRQNYTPRHFISIANELYTTGKFQNLSLMMNDIRKTGPGYGYEYGYGYGYSYGYYTSGKNKPGNEYYVD
jgi:capsular exopolysaccharide synthesis family protein